MAPRGYFAASFLLFQLLFSSVCHGLVETCEELQAAFDLTKTQDVVIEVDPIYDIDCAEFTTMTMDSNSLTVKSSDDHSNYDYTVELSEIRFEVLGGSTLFWEPSVEFTGKDARDVDGGGVHVGEGSTVHFSNRLEMSGVRVHSVTDNADFATYHRNGGCVYTDGYFQVDGKATFTGCHNTGGGESNSGPGGAFYVAKKGSVVLNDELDISETYVNNEGGNDGGGFYNAGSVEIMGDATFTTVYALDGSAIYNAVGATFRFKNKAVATFIDCLDPEAQAGAVYNEGYLKFSGPALFYGSGNPAIFVSADGQTVLSKPAVFWGNYGKIEPFIEVEPGGSLVIPKSTLFIGNDESDCSTVYYEETDTCL